jgi:general stress protein CsbA
MLLRILGEVVVGVLVAGIVAAVLVPASTQLGFTTGPWLVWVALAGSIAACVAIGERRNRRAKARQSP